MKGIYLHVPFCDGKCPYCDFYSIAPSQEKMDGYLERARGELREWSRKMDGKIETVYFGGGTPNLLGGRRIAGLLETIGDCFSLEPGVEITLEANPGTVDREFFRTIKQAGVNRLSMGLQSANEDELRLLGRKHRAEDVARAAEDAREAGIQNISLDLMLALPGGSREKLLRSIEFAASLAPEHISCYLLKIEEGTPFGARTFPDLPEEEESAEEYLFLVEELKKRGYAQYEISNFARPGRESRHNLLYWHGDEYLGVGPGAHSFLGKRRFYHVRNLQAYCAGESLREEGEGGDFEEFAMLNLRLTRGLTREACQKRFGKTGEAAFAEVGRKAKNCPGNLVSAGEERIFFTPRGFLVSNALLARILDLDS